MELLIPPLPPPPKFMENWDFGIFPSFSQFAKQLGNWHFYPGFHILSDCEDCLSGRVYVLCRGDNSHYVTVLRLVKCWKHCLQTQMRVKKTLKKPPVVPVNFWNKPHLFANTSLCSDSSQYAIIISQSLIRFFFTSRLELKHKRFLND